MLAAFQDNKCGLISALDSCMGDMDSSICSEELSSAETTAAFTSTV